MRMNVKKIEVGTYYCTIVPIYTWYIAAICVRFLILIIYQDYNFDYTIIIIHIIRAYQEHLKVKLYCAYEYYE